MNLEDADLAKENIQPLRQGRIVGHLGTALQAQHDVSAVQELNAERDKFELLLRTYDGDDPLQPWFEYIEWVEQTYIKHGREGNLLPLLENCLAQFKDDFKYNQDVRYVKLWIKYINMADNPLELYNQMFSHGIGTLCSLFYRSWADELFQNDDYKLADKVYKNGLQVKAQPLEELETAHANFQVAVARRILDTSHNVSEIQPHERRQAGNVLNTFGSKHKVSSQRTGSHVSQHHPGVLKPKNDATITRNIHQGIKVFDEGDSENKMPKSNHKMQTGPKHQTLVKENTKKPGPWNDIQVKSSIEHIKMKPSFPVHEENLSPQKNHYNAEVRLSALKPKKTDAWLCPLAIFEPPDPSKRAMYPKDKVYSGGTEYSLEELRAVRYFQRTREKKDFATIEVQQASIKESNGDAVEDKQIPEKCSNVKIYSEQDEIPEKCSNVKIYSEQDEIHEKCSNVKIYSEQDEIPEKCSNVKISSEQDEIPEKCSNVKIYSEQDEILACSSLPPVIEKCTARLSETVDIKPKQANVPTFTLFIDEEDCPQVINSQESTACRTSESTSNVPHNVSSKENVFSRQLTNFVEQPVYRKEQKMTECIPTASMLKITKRKHTTSDKTENGHQASDKTTGSVFKVPVKPDSSIHSHTENTEDVLKVVNECWTTPKQKKVECDWAVQKRGEVVKEKLFLEEKCDVEIPRVPSPGMNQAELDKLEGTENKENDFIKPFHIQNDDSDNEELAHPLDLENMFKKPFDKVKTPVNEDNWFQRGNQSARFLDDTCTTQLFCQSLISSTPIRKSLKLAHSRFNQENLYMPTELQIEKDSCTKNTEPDPKFTKTEKITETLSVILENSKEYKSSISSGSSSVVTRETYNLVQSWRESHAITSELSKISEVSAEPNYLEYSKADVKSATVIDEKSCSDSKSVEKKSIDYILDGNIDPFDHNLTKNILKYYNYPDKCDVTIIKEETKLPNMRLSSTIHLGGSNYYLACELGEGAYAKVYCGVDENKHKFALKVVNETNVWELYISEQIKKRLKNESLFAFFSFPLQSYGFSNGIIFASECCEMGTLINIINLWKTNNSQGLPESVCLCFTRELLQILKILHECKIIHGDFKADNIIVKSLFPFSLKLIDFGRSIDLNAFPEGTKFTTVITTEDMKCTEMRSNLPWTYQIDLFGLVGIVHCLIFSDYMKLYNRGSWKILKTVPRWFNREKWNNFFHDFLNIESCDNLPDLAYWIDEMTTVLEKCAGDYTKAESLWMKIKKQIV